ncbi:MAG: hypothetical protein ACR2F6_00860 [Mycobacteriales bacterium]
MNGTLDAVIITASLLLASASGLWAALDRPVPDWQFAGAAVLEALAIAVVTARAGGRASYPSEGMWSRNHLEARTSCPSAVSRGVLT